MTLVFLDTETTHLDDRYAQVWEVAAIVRRAGEEEECCWQLRPDLTLADPRALGVGGYYRRCSLTDAAPGTAVRLHVKNAWRGRAEQVAAKLALLLDGAVVVGSNPAYDERVLTQFLRAHGQCWSAHYRTVDVAALAAGFLQGRAAEEHPAVARLPWHSQELYRAVGVDPDDYPTHTALGDARLARDVFDALCPGGGA